MTPRNSSRFADAARPGPSGPVRTCVGCRRRAARSDLVRLVVSAGNVVIDESQSMPGRGAYLHPAAACWDRARYRRAIGRALRQPEASHDALLPDADRVAREPGGSPPTVPNRRKIGIIP